MRREEKLKYPKDKIIKQGVREMKMKVKAIRPSLRISDLIGIANELLEELPGEEVVEFHEELKACGEDENCLLALLARHNVFVETDP